MMNRKWQRIIVAIIAVILALTMILGLVMPAMASDFDSSTESSLVSDVPDDESSISAPSEDTGKSKERTILNGVTIGSVDVSGMTGAEAQAAGVEDQPLPLRLQ